MNKTLRTDNESNLLLFFLQLYNSVISSTALYFMLFTCNKHNTFFIFNLMVSLFCHLIPGTSFSKTPYSSKSMIGACFSLYLIAVLIYCVIPHTVLFTNFLP